MKEQVEERNFLIYSAVSIMPFVPKVFITQRLLVMGTAQHKKLVAEMPWEPNIPLIKLECIGHVQRRMEARLKGFVKEKVGTNLHDNKPLGTKGSLTQYEIK
jgi:hypothetical protein